MSTNVTKLPEEPLHDCTKPPVIEGVARKPSNEIVISLEELEKKTSQDSKYQTRVVPQVIEESLEHSFRLSHHS